MNRKSLRRSSQPLSRPRTGRGGTLLGIFIGLVIGLSIAAAVAYLLGRSGLTSPMSASPGAREPARGSKNDLNAAANAPEKPRFDFYKILPGGDEPKPSTERRAAEKSPERSSEKPLETAKMAEPPAKAGERFWLQAGAFASVADAEDMKARLALSGWEASIQTVPMPDKTQRYRVRLGPYDNTDELNRMKKELGSRGFDVAVIKNQ